MNKVGTRYSRDADSFLVIIAELLFHKTVKSFDLLLLSKLDRVIRHLFFALPLGSTFFCRFFDFHKGALMGQTTSTLEHQLFTLSLALFA